MLIAREKKRTNIAEYIIYMWQIEDSVRAYNLDIELIKRNIIDAYNQTDEIKKEIRFWYESLIEMMKSEKIEEKGHLQLIKNILDDLTDLHLYLLKSPFHSDYRTAYKNATESLIEFHSKLKVKNKTEIEVCFEALYSIFLLKLQKKDISTETIEAVKSISYLLALLAKKYLERENEKLQ